MNPPNNGQLTRTKDLLGLAAFLAVCFVVSFVGGLLTATSVSTWYPTLNKPSLTPPDWIFGPVWAVLYALMAIAAWRVWRVGGFRTNPVSQVLFSCQLALNLLWSFLFFVVKRVDLALFGIVALLIAIVLTAVLFWRVDRVAGVLFAPYILWVAFATYLNASIWALN